MSKREQWVVGISSAVAAASPVAIGLAGKEPWWVIALAFAGTFAATIAGWRGLSRPADARELDEANGVPLSSRRL